MTLRHMKIYVAVFHHSNITKAAEELHLAQGYDADTAKAIQRFKTACCYWNA